MNAEQVQPIRDMIAENFPETQKNRQEGGQGAATVAPLEKRLRQIVPMEIQE